MAIQPHGVNLVEIGQGVITVGQIADLFDGRDIAIHRVDGLERHDLGRLQRKRLQLFLEIGHVVMAENHFLGAGMADAFDHRRMVGGVGEHHAALQTRGNCAERCPVRQIARIEQQRCFLAMQRGKFGFECHMLMIGTGDIACTACPGAAALEALMHGFEHVGVLTHAEIVVGAPDGDVAFQTMMIGVRKLARMTLKLCEMPIAAICLEPIKGRLEIPVIDRICLRHLFSFSSVLSAEQVKALQGKLNSRYGRHLEERIDRLTRHPLQSDR